MESSDEEDDETAPSSSADVYEVEVLLFDNCMTNVTSRCSQKS